MSGESANTGPSLVEVLSSYGDVETAPLSRIQLLTAKAMARNWATIPHVTHQDLIDVTRLEDHRGRFNTGLEKTRQLSPVPFLLKAVANVLAEAPRFNAVLDEANKAVILRRYINIGVAIDNGGGLVVGVIRGCDTRSVEDLAEETNRLVEKARGRGLALSDMSGSGFTVSSLGAAGGTGFTPIINAPEVAILGVSRMSHTPRPSRDGQVEWRKTLPVSLSYDHRVINGADAGRFMSTLQAQLDALVSARTADQ
jgi:pyruvate dehydrogenase E2 component (dihydrolipoamide acetyltransferase)